MTEEVKWNMSLKSLEEFAYSHAKEQRKLRKRHLSYMYPRLYVSDYTAAENVTNLQKKGITAILRIHQSNASEHTLQQYAKAGIRFKCIILADSHHADIKQHFAESNTFIEEEISKRGRVLVHCHRGCNRSATLMLWFMINWIHRHDTPKESIWGRVYVAMKMRRPLIDPPLTYLNQIKAAEEELLSCVS